MLGLMLAVIAAAAATGYGGAEFLMWWFGQDGW